jgi:hypothetical protein
MGRPVRGECGVDLSGMGGKRKFAACASNFRPLAIAVIEYRSRAQHENMRLSSSGAPYSDRNLRNAHECSSDLGNPHKTPLGVDGASLLSKMN